MKHWLSMAFCVISMNIMHGQLLEPGVLYGIKDLRGISILIDDGMLAEAGKQFRQSLVIAEQGSHADEASILRSLMMRQSGDVQYADIALDKFIQQRPNSPFLPIALIERGSIAYYQTDMPKAIEYFGKVVEISREKAKTDSLHAHYCAMSLYWKGASQARGGNPDDAGITLKEIQSLYPIHELADDALYMRAQLRERSGAEQEAIALYGELLRTYPQRNTALSSSIRASNIKLGMREPNAAIAYMEQAQALVDKLQSQDTTIIKPEVQSFSDHAIEDLSFMRAQALVLAKQSSQAYDAFLAFMNAYPQSPIMPHAKMSAGYAAFHLGKYNEAEALYRYVIDSTNEEHAFLKAGAKLYHGLIAKAKGERDRAKKEFAALTMQTGYQLLGHALLEYGQLVYEDNEMETARKTFERALRETQEKSLSVKLHLLLGSVYHDQEQFGKSAREYASAERMVLSMSKRELENRESILAEARLKQGISLHQNEQYRDAIIEISTFLGEHKVDARRDQALFWLAESYYKTDLLTNAEEFFTQLLSDYPNSNRKEESMYGIAWAQFRRREFAKSSQSFSKLVKEFPQTRFATDALARKGDGHYALRQFKDAAAAYKSAMNAGPRSEEGQYSAYQYGQALYRIDDFEGAIKAFRIFARSYPQSPLSASALYSVGWTLFQQRKYDDAIQELKSLLVVFPSTQLAARTHYTIADAYYNLERYDDAIASYTVVKNQYPSSPLAGEAVKSIQYSLEFLGRVDEANVIVDDFISKNPQSEISKDLLMNRGLSFYNGKNYAGAITEYEAFLKSNSDIERNAEALFYLGKSFSSLGESGKAEQSWKDVFKKYGKTEFAPLALLEIGLMKVQDKRYREADTAFAMVMTEFPENASSAQAGFERAQIATTLGDSLQALRLYSLTAEIYDKTEFGDQSRYRIAMYYRSRTMFDSAIVHFRQIAKRMENPTIAAEAQYRIGELWMKQKEYANAITAFLEVREQSSSIEDWFSLSLLGLGDCYETLKNYDAANEVFQTLITLRPDDDYGKTASARLKRIQKAKP